MNLTQHPEYKKYLSDKALTQTIHVQLTAWIEVNEVAGEALKTAVSQLTSLFKEYNRVMWQEFPFCKMCLGGCCVVGASEISSIDAAALSVMGQVLPILPVQTHQTNRACIYLGAQGCTWPADWKPLKCMTFFSLGSGDWQLERADDRYGRLTKALQAVFIKFLPLVLGEDNTLDTQDLADPIQFAPLLSRLLADKFLPAIVSGDSERSQPIPVDPITVALLAIVALTEQLRLESPDMLDQLLADIEQFEWVVTGHPAREREILAEINGRCTAQDHPIYLQFSQDIQQFWNSTHNHLEIL